MEGVRLEDIDFGVCDSPEQLASAFPEYKGKVWMTVVKRDDKYEVGGWRWRKWGPYIGEHDLYQVEYLNECDGEEGRPLIDEQWLFDTREKVNNVLSLEPYQAYMIENGEATPLAEFAQDHHIILKLARSKGFMF